MLYWGVNVCTWQGHELVKGNLDSQPYENRHWESLSKKQMLLLLHTLREF